MGGSTVQGSPYTIETSFTTWLELSLQAADPDRHWDVVNCGGLSYASYRLVPILQEVLTHEPDLIVLYTGHNEFLEDRTYAHVKRVPRWLAHLHSRLSQLRLYNACRGDRLSNYSGGTVQRRPHAGPRPRSTRGWTIPMVARRPSIQTTAWRNAAIVDHPEATTSTAWCALPKQADVPVVICNPVSNLKDCPPFKFEHAELSVAQQKRFESLWTSAKDLSEKRNGERIELLRQALAIDDRHAGMHFLLGHCYVAANRLEEAKAEFIRREDEDTVR